MQDVRIDETGNFRCWKCGGKNFTRKRTFRSKALVGVGALTTHKKLKCQACGEYNDTGSAKPFDPAMVGQKLGNSPAAVKARREAETRAKDAEIRAELKAAGRSAGPFAVGNERANRKIAEKAAHKQAERESAEPPPAPPRLSFGETVAERRARIRAKREAKQAKQGEEAGEPEHAPDVRSGPDDVEPTAPGSESVAEVPAEEESATVALPSSLSAADELAKLVQLRDSGVLTDDEFNALKGKLIQP